MLLVFVKMAHTLVSQVLAFEQSIEAVLPAWKFFFFLITSLLNSNQNQSSMLFM